MNMTKFVAQWLARADDDIKISQLALGEDGPPNPICFHCQQAAEKYLKAFLAHHGKHIRKVHNLENLLQNCRDIDKSFHELFDDASYLSQFYVESRYPGDYPEFTLQDTKKALEAALIVKDFVLEKINKKSEN